MAKIGKVDMTTLNADKPIDKQEEDRLNRAKFARRLAETIAERKDHAGLTIGLYSQWGDGKTSVLNMMREVLGEDKYKHKILTLDFNPWLIKSAEDLIQTFFDHLAAVYPKDFSGFNQRARNILTADIKKLDYCGGARILGRILSWFGWVSIPFLDLEKLSERLASRTLQTYKKDIIELLQKKDQKVVVFIDDIDRLDQDEIYAVLKQVRMTADLGYITYVLAFDHEVVASAVGKRYGEGKTADGKAFLEKIIQVPLHLPMADPGELRKYIRNGIDKTLEAAGITHEGLGESKACFDRNLLPKLSTLRLSNLYSNAISFALPILKDEVNHGDLMLIEGIRICYPALYEQIRKNRDVFLYGNGGIVISLASSSFIKSESNGPSELVKNSPTEYKKSALSLLEKCYPEMSSSEREYFLDNFLLYLFPGLLGPMNYYKVNNNEKRICSVAHFDKYFMYAVPLSDLSDVEIAEFLGCLESGDEIGASDCFDALKGNIAVLVDKLTLRAKIMNSVTAQGLLAFINEHQSEIDLNLLDWKPYHLFGELLKRIDDDGFKREFLLKFAVEAEPLVGVLQQFVGFEQSSDSDYRLSQLVSDNTEKEILAALVDRAWTEDTKKPLYTRENYTASRAYRIIVAAGKKNELTQRLEERFRQSPKDVDEFLNNYIMETGDGELYLDFFHKVYQDITQTIDPKIIADALQNHYGEKLSGDDLPDSNALKLARQFMRFYEAQTNVNQETEPQGD